VFDVKITNIYTNSLKFLSISLMPNFLFAATHTPSLLTRWYHEEEEEAPVLLSAEKMSIAI
jgi:hypothetical protein